jgi:hypothetical protein
MDVQELAAGVDTADMPDAGAASVQMAQANAAVVAVLLPVAEEAIKVLVDNATELINATLTRLPSVADDTVSPLIHKVRDEAHSLIWGLLSDLAKPVLCILIVAQVCSTLITLCLLECGGKVLAIWRAREKHPEDKSCVVERDILMAAASDGGARGVDQFVDAMPCYDAPYCHDLPVGQPTTTICLLSADVQARGHVAEAARWEQPRRQDPGASSCLDKHNFSAAHLPSSCTCPPPPPAPACLHGFQDQAQGATERSDCNQGRENDHEGGLSSSILVSPTSGIASGSPITLGCFALKFAIPALYSKETASAAGQGVGATNVSGAGACETGQGKRLSWGCEASRGVVQVLRAGIASAPNFSRCLHRRSKSSPALHCALGADTSSLLQHADVVHTDLGMLPTCKRGFDSGALAVALAPIIDARLSLVIPRVRWSAIELLVATNLSAAASVHSGKHVCTSDYVHQTHNNPQASGRTPGLK